MKKNGISMTKKQKRITFFVIACFTLGIMVGWGPAAADAFVGNWVIDDKDNLGLKVTSGSGPIDSSGPFITATNIYPGWTTADTLTVTNDGSASFDYSFYISSSEVATSDSLLAVLEVSIFSNGAPLFQNVPFDSITIEQPESTKLDLGSLAAKSSNELTFRFDWPTEYGSGNEYQGKSLNVDFIIEAGPGEEYNPNDPDDDDPDPNPNDPGNKPDYEGESTTPGENPISEPLNVPGDTTETAPPGEASEPSLQSQPAVPVSKGVLPRTGMNTTGMTVAGLSLLLAGSVLGFIPTRKK